jgi:pyruvate,water dikinase
MELFERVLNKNKSAGPDLEARIACFREILHANNAALGFIAEIQEALSATGHLAASHVSRIVTGVTVQTYRMVSNLVRMTGRKSHRELIPRFDILKKEIGNKLGPTPALKPYGFVIPHAEVSHQMAEAVGTKNAHLAEVRRILGGCVPDGFATTVEAYRTFMHADDLGSRIASAMELLDWADITSCFEVSARIVQMIETSRVPEELARSIESAASALMKGPDTRFAVRSSALQEDGLEASFAGQYRSMLNIPRDGIVDAFRHVIASKYAPQAIVYRMKRGFNDAEVAMCCCVVTMVNSVAAGVMYTSYPTPSGTRSILQAVRGLGLSAVDGSVEPDTYTLNSSTRKILDMKMGLQDVLLRSASVEGTERVEIDEHERRNPAVTRQQALAVAELAWKIESELKMALDIEWAIDAQGSPFILQVRPLSNISGGTEEAAKPRMAGAEVLVDKGTRASRGVGFGKVHRVETDLDILRCPTNCVIATHEANPRFAVLLPKAAAIVADRGEITGHLATVARELHVPALFATRDATLVLRSGEEVTVDADAGVVYAGRVDAALQVKSQVNAIRNPNRELLQSIAEFIIPLTLRDRLASGYSPKKCKTIHDIIRFCHQATIEAMFDLGDKALRQGRSLRRLVSPVPIDCRIIDLGGGLTPDSNDGDVEIGEVICRPMLHLWRGMTDPRLNWRQLRPVSLRGFMSAVVDYNFDQDFRLRPMGEPSYAFVSADYLNLNSRIGYHFSTIDSRICETIESNYASFRFVGGSTGITQRSRRAQLLERLLSASGFETDCRADLINARIRYRPPDEMDNALFKIGLLMGYVNHLDMALVSNEIMNKYVDAFLAGNYAFKGSEDQD